MIKILQKSSSASLLTEDQIDPAKQHYWDPAGDIIQAGMFDGDIVKIQKRIQNLKNNPNLYYKWMMLCLIPGILISVVAYFLQGPFYEYAGNIVWAFIVPISVFLFYIKKISIDIVKLAIANKKNWLFSPNFDLSRVQRLKNVFPELFKIGHSHGIEDQFWGTIAYNEKEIPFWSSYFEYTVGHGKHKKVYNRNLIAVPLPSTSLTGDFSIVSDSFELFGDTGSAFHTESVAFNKAFDIHLNADKAQVVRLLSPVVQEKCLQLKKDLQLDSIIWKSNTILFNFRTNLFSIKKSIWHPAQLENLKTQSLETSFSMVLTTIMTMRKYVD